MLDLNKSPRNFSSNQNSNNKNSGDISPLKERIDKLGGLTKADFFENF